jgi:pimeloyl-ACP methyl ester carboxylesterase
MKGLELQNVTLVGHDVGGMVVYAYLHTYPDELRRAVIMNVAVPGRVSGSSETKTYGKGVALREHEEQYTLPRRSVFGKDEEER